MGTLYYGDARATIAIEDRLLAHLQVVMVSKLRRNEPFTLSWSKPGRDSAHRATVWISAQALLEFEFDHSELPELNRQWIEALAQAASTASGLSLTIPEPLAG